MAASWPFWIMAATLAACVALLIARPLLRSSAGAERRASYDMRVYRDQLREIDSDLTRGAIAADEAAAVRVEVSRRLLAAADAEAAEAAAAAAPRQFSRGAAAALAAVLLAGALGIYGALGRPGLYDAPLAARLEALAVARANRPGQAAVEAMAAEQSPPAGAAEGGAAGGGSASPDMALIEQLRAAVAARPNDVEGQRLLARTELTLGNWAAARAARERVVALLGTGATAADYLDLAEAMILAAGGYVSPEAEAALMQSLQRAPQDPTARYYSGLALLQGGRPDLTYRLWARLLAEGPPDAPWIAPIEAQMAEVSALAGRQAPAPAAGPVPSPGLGSGADPAGASGDGSGGDAMAGMSEADRSEMIEGMVTRLSDRLAAEGGPAEDWAQLIRSLGVLGRKDEAAAIWREAREVFAADPAALGLLRETAIGAGAIE